MSIGLADIFASVRLNLETGEFEANAAKVADSAGATMGKRMSTVLRGALGAGAGLAFGAMVTGANELDAATRKLQADTGMTADEARVAEGALAGMYQNNLQGFGQIGDAMAKVHNDLGLTEQAANDTTELFLKFATATGQDAAGAVTQADDTLDAFNLTAADSAELLDKLIVSHQKYGGSITESQAALAKMAPALTGLNMNLDDGIALLNLFNAAGIDAAKVPQALAQALKKVKSPEEFKALLRDIANTADPFQRAQKAVALFGNRAGPQLATALAASGGDLSQFGISMTEAAGATDKAAKSVESGFGAQFTLLLHKAGGALADFGTNFGPLLMAASVVGPSMLRGITTAFGSIAGLLAPRLIAMLAPVMTSVGIASGATLDGGIATGMVLGIPALVGLVIAALGTGLAVALDAAVPNLSRNVHDWFFDGLGAVGDIIGGRDWQHKVVTPAVEGSAAAGEAAGTALTGGIVDGVEAGTPDVTTAANSAAAALLAPLGKLAPSAKFLGMAATSEFAAGILSAQGLVGSAFAALKNQEQTELAPTAEIAYLVGVLTSKELAKGLKDSRPGVRDQAKKTQEMAETRLRELVAGGGKVGKDTNTALAKGMKDKDPDVRAQAKRTKGIVTTELNTAKGPAWTAGMNVGTAFGNGVVQAAISILDDLASIIGPYLTATVSVHPVNKYGSGKAAGGPVSAGMPYVVGERGPELFVPNQSGSIVPNSSIVGPTVNVTVNAGSDVSAGTARRFGQIVADTVAGTLRQQNARTAGPVRA